MQKFHHNDYEESNESSKKWGVGIISGGLEVPDLKFSCCRMEHEDYFEEESDQEIEVGQQGEVVGVVAPMPIEILLEMQVAPPADNPQQPSLSPPTSLP